MMKLLLAVGFFHAVTFDLGGSIDTLWRNCSTGAPARRCQLNNPSNCALLLIFFPPSALHELLAPLFPNPRAWEATAIRLPTAEIRATIRVMAVDAFAAPRR